LNSLNTFKGRQLLIVTKHQKEIVMAPLLEKNLEVCCSVSHGFDTDFFGTFSGEINRVGGALVALRNKCLAAMEFFEADLAVASEGSFGAHPTVFFAAADDELMILIDKKNDLEIVAREISLHTNFCGTSIETEKELLDFAEKVKFPSHGIILKTKLEDNLNIIKGIQTSKELLDSFYKLKSEFGVVYAETDMRAMYNPTRMNIIESVTKKLVQNSLSRCSKCDSPGFCVSEIKTGLPCESCNVPTNATLSHIYKCKKCSFSEELFFPNKKKTEDPAFCDFCNP
jgi:hypothetical protein